jgi:hypothetical protein
MGRPAAGQSGARSGFAGQATKTLESFGKTTRRDVTCKRKSWCADEINYQQTCLQENRHSLHASQRKKQQQNMRYGDMQWWGISPPMCDH